MQAVRCKIKNQTLTFFMFLDGANLSEDCKIILVVQDMYVVRTVVSSEIPSCVL